MDEGKGRVDPAGQEARKLKLAVLISGGGTNLQALIDRSSAGSLAAEIVAVISDRPEAYGLERARAAGIPAHVVDYKVHLQRSVSDPLAIDLPVDLERLAERQRILKIPDRRKLLERLAKMVLAERELLGILDGYRPDYVCLAGFMRLVTPYFLGHYQGEGYWRVLNIHPALLPAFPGQHGYEDTLAYGCRWGGITVHFADEGEDTGPIIAQAVYPIWPGDSIERVRRRGLELEHRVYAQCINWLAGGYLLVRTLPGGRRHVHIADPAYVEIVRAWTAGALA